MKFVRNICLMLIFLPVVSSEMISLLADKPSPKASENVTITVIGKHKCSIHWMKNTTDILCSCAASGCVSLVPRYSCSNQGVNITNFNWSEDGFVWKAQCDHATATYIFSKPTSEMISLLADKPSPKASENVTITVIGKHKCSIHWMKNTTDILCSCAASGCVSLVPRYSCSNQGVNITNFNWSEDGFVWKAQCDHATATYIFSKPTYKINKLYAKPGEFVKIHFRECNYGIIHWIRNDNGNVLCACAPSGCTSSASRYNCSNQDLYIKFDPSNDTFVIKAECDGASEYYELNKPNGSPSIIPGLGILFMGIVTVWVFAS